MMILIKLVTVILNIIYFFIKLLPTGNKIVMISRQSNEVNIDFKLLGNEFEGKYKVIYLCKTLDGGVKARLMAKVTYLFHMFRQMYHLATSKACILDTYCPTVSILKHKKKLVIVQIWHSIGNMKKSGYRILGKQEGNDVLVARAMKMHQNYTFACVASDAYKKDLSLSFNMPEERFKVLTLPRVDLLNDKKYETEVKKEIYKRYPILKEKENIVYAPTFRKDESKFNEYLNKLVDAIDLKKYNLIVKLHPLSKVKVENDLVIVDNEFSAFDMLFIADYLISDYSCIIYEAGIKDIPLYFYKYDISDYENVRGLAIDYQELPGYQEVDAKKLASDLEKEYDFKYHKKFIKKYVENIDKCAKKMADEIINCIEGK